MRFVLAPQADQAAELLTLPWDLRLEDWYDQRLVEVPGRGISRHIVRFVGDSDALYAIKEINEDIARREYRLLREMAAHGMPAVRAVGVIVDRGPDLDACLVTKFLSYSTSYRALFSMQRMDSPADRLLDALVQLIVRLHLGGVFWGDCSLSNTLFRLDAGALAAYLVDAETAEMHPSLSDGQRNWDVQIAAEHVAGELMDLEAGGLLPEELDPTDLALQIPERYALLWDELTRTEVFSPDEQRYRIAERLHRLNEMGFDVDEVELVSAEKGNRLRLLTRIAEPGFHRRRLEAKTGLVVQENQARRLLNDIASFGGYLRRKENIELPSSVVASRWLEEVYQPIVSAVPDTLADRLAPAEIFHEILVHRWYLSESAGTDVGTTAAAQSYVDTVLPRVPEQLTSGRAVVHEDGRTG